jgi:hypothetical protein
LLICRDERTIAEFIPFAILWTLLAARLFSREDGRTSLIGFNLSNSADNGTLRRAAYLRRAPRCAYAPAPIPAKRGVDFNQPECYCVFREFPYMNAKTIRRARR